VRGAAVLVGALVGLAAGEARGGTVDRSIEVGGVVRSYLLHVPEGIDRTKPVPVVLVFHGAESDVESMERATGLDALADRERFLVAYLRARVPARRYDTEVAPGAAASNDARFVKALLDRLRGRFAVDERRIYATGFSNGGAFCYRAVADLPGTFAAIAPVAGYLPPSLASAPASVASLLHVHGTRDARVPSDVTGAAATWARWAGCRGAPAESAAPEMAPLAARRVRPPSPAGTEVSVLLVEGVGHVWPGGPSGPLARVLWDFFRAHPGPEIRPVGEIRTPSSR
jgi:polyhydroxybutyrate depolymerase